jgi:hypothetical protein
MSKRLDSRSLGLPHLGQNLGVGLLCLRFPTTSRMFRSVPMDVVGSFMRVASSWFMLRRCFLLGSPFLA